MDQFLQSVQQAMVAKGWGEAAAAAQINFDPDHLLELKAEGMSASSVAVEVERQYQTRHSQSVKIHAEFIEAKRINFVDAADVAGMVAAMDANDEDAANRLLSGE